VRRAKSGGGVWPKKYPPSRGVMATLPAKAVQSYRFFSGSVWVFLGVFGGCFVWRSGWCLGCFAYLCGMATLQVVGVAAKAAWCSVPDRGRRKMRLQTPKTPVGHE
jgi:hypothetical protein